MGFWEKYKARTKELELKEIADWKKQWKIVEGEWQLGTDERDIFQEILITNIRKDGPMMQFDSIERCSLTEVKCRSPDCRKCRHAPRKE